jgi:hypothetical protein
MAHGAFVAQGREMITLILWAALAFMLLAWILPALVTMGGIIRAAIARRFPALVKSRKLW